MKDEIATIYNCFNQEIGTASKKDVHKKGLWHRAVSFIILDTAKKEIIFQHHESPEKINWETFFVKLNGGHVQHGEKPIDAFRELEEELGLKDKAKNSLYVGTYQLSVQFSENFINNEFIYFYIVPGENIKDEMNFIDDEVASIISVNVYDALETILGNKGNIDAELSDLKTNTTILLNQVNFKNFTDDNLYLRIMIAAKRYLDGENKSLILI